VRQQAGALPTPTTATNNNKLVPLLPPGFLQQWK
jgi:hypothetical protein